MSHDPLSHWRPYARPPPRIGHDPGTMRLGIRLAAFDAGPDRAWLSPHQIAGAWPDLRGARVLRRGSARRRRFGGRRDAQPRSPLWIAPDLHQYALDSG